MDCSKVGALIRALREEAGLTQLQLAEKLGVSDRAVSKWECGRGAPDVTLLGALSAALKVNVEGLLAGELPGGAEEGGNMKKAKWYVCPACGGLTVSSGGAEVRFGEKGAAGTISPDGFMMEKQDARFRAKNAETRQSRSAKTPGSTGFPAKFCGNYLA